MTPEQKQQLELLFACVCVGGAGSAGLVRAYEIVQGSNLELDRKPLYSGPSALWASGHLPAQRHEQDNQGG